MSLRYEVVPGSGLVAREGESILWVGEHVAPALWEALGAVLRLSPGTDPAGGDTAAQLQHLQHALEQHPDTVFAILLVEGAQAQGLLRGPVTIRNRTEVAPAAGHGPLGVTVPFAMSESVYVGYREPVTNPPAVSELADLDSGIVPGGGAWVHPVSAGRRHATGVHPVAEADPPHSGAFSSPSTTVQWSPQPEDDEPAAATGSLPVGAPQTGAHPVAVPPLPAVGATGSWASPVAAGAAPADGALAAFVPAADYQRVDLRAATPNGRRDPLPIAAARPQPAPQAVTRSVGAIVFEDGSTFALDRDYVVGRRPEKDPRVQSHQASALTVADPDTVLSSAHALVALRGGQVFLTDLGSLNGTHVAPPGAQDWSRIAAHQEVPITPGTRLLFGWTVATYSGG